MKFQTSYAGYGADPDEEELLGTLLAQSPGPAPAPQQSPDLEPPEPMGGLQAPLLADRTSYAQPAASSGGPPAYTPEPMAHVPDRGFGVQDVGMLAAIIGAALVGGKHGRQAIPGMIGSYAQSYGQDVDRRNAQNQRIDMYNAQQAERHNPRQQYFEDQRSAQAATELDLQKQNLLARNRGLDLQTSQEARIAAAAEREAAIDPVEQARKIAQARADVDLETHRKRNDMDVGTREMLGIITGNQRRAAAGGKGAAGPASPGKQLKNVRDQAMLDGINNGTIDPVTGKPKEPPKDAKKRTPFADTEFENEELFNEKNSTASNYQKNSNDDASMASGIAAFREMEDLLTKYGSQAGTDQESAALLGQFDTAKGKVQSAMGTMKTLGILQPREAELIDKAIGADMGYGMADGAKLLGRGDPRVGRLQGARQAFENALVRSRHANGLKARGTKAGPQSSFGEPPSDNVTGGGKRLVTIRTKDGRSKQAELTDAAIQELQSDPRIESVQ